MLQPEVLGHLTLPVLIGSVKSSKNKMASAYRERYWSRFRDVSELCVSVSEGCEGNRCLFTGWEGELMTLSLLCSQV